MKFSIIFVIFFAVIFLENIYGFFSPISSSTLFLSKFGNKSFGRKTKVELVNFLNFFLLSRNKNGKNNDKSDQEKSENSVTQNFDSNTVLKTLAISDPNGPNIDIKKEEHDENKPKIKKYFIYVDPLDDFGSATVAREKCEELGTPLTQLRKSHLL
jgi:hypothetical protein